MQSCEKCGGFRRRNLTAALIVVAFSSSWFVQETRAASVAGEPPQLSERAAQAVTEINRLLALEEWSAAMAAADHLLASVRSGTFDADVAHLFRAQIFLSRNDAARGDPAAAIPELERVIAGGFWPRERVLEWTFTLAQLYAQQAQPEKTEKLMLAWLAESSAPTPAAYVLLVGAMFERAQRDSAHPDRSLLEDALTRVDEGLLLGIHPDETLLYLQAACLQALQRWDEAAETLEFILSRNPKQRERWEQLYGMYASSGRNLDALLTIERARAFGALTSPQSDLVRGQLYHSLDQDRRAIAALEAGLHRGVAEPAPHWIFAAFLAYQVHDFAGASRLLAEAKPHLTDDAQRRDWENLREALAALPGR